MDNITINDKLGVVKVERAARCRTNIGDSVSVSFTIDYMGCTVADIVEWATSTKVIAGQRAWEKYSPSELKEKVHGKTFHASSIGQKIVSDKELAQRLGKDRLLKMISEMEELEETE